MINVREIIEEHLPTEQAVDFLSLDCEGMDLGILEAFPFGQVRPKVVAVEDFDISGESPIHRLLSDRGYYFASLAKITKIFVLGN